jgi:hypothetical protein
MNWEGGKKQSWPILRNYHSSWLGGLTKATKTLHHGSWSLVDLRPSE